jgi:hypothetical protein
MTETTTPAGTASAAPAGGTKDTAEETRPKPNADVLKAARKLGKVIMHPSPADVEANPNARGYDELGRLRPADARAVYLVAPKDVEALADPTPEERGERMREARKAAEKARKAAEKNEG